jgi:hypothetical protein
VGEVNENETLQAFRDYFRIGGNPPIIRFSARFAYRSFRAKKIDRIDVQSTRNRRGRGNDCGKQDDEAGSRQLNGI